MPESAIATFLKNQSSATDSLLSPKEAAKKLGVTEQTLAVWRCTGRYGIQFVKVGRLVKYRDSVLEAFLDDRTHG